MVKGSIGCSSSTRYQHQNNTNTTAMHMEEMDMDMEMETETQTGTCPSEVLTLFGMEGPVGSHFVKLALSAGYRVQALVPPDALLPPIQHDSLEIHIAELDRVEESVLQDLLMHSTHVVCLWTCQGYSTLSPSSSSSSSSASSSSTKRGGAAGGENKENNMSKTKKRYPPGALFKFVQRLYPLVKESTARVFLYQATSIAIDTYGQAPLLANAIKWVRNNPYQKDVDAIVKFIGENTEDWFYYIVTRPGLTREGPTRKPLAASRSQPGPVPVSNVDLAEFSLSALRMENLYNSCPYVVGDGF